MKKFVNLPANAVDESLSGLVLANDDIRLHSNNRRIVLRSELNTLKKDQIVTLISGGGSGHEPFAAGYVGKNALTGAVAGDIFASPSSASIFTAVKAVCSDAGTIVFVINYTGDRLNFGIAVEKLRSESSSEIDLIYVDDDVALEHKENVIGARGLAGASLLIHIIGVLAEKYKMNFEALTSFSREIVSQTATLGVNLEPCALPGQGKMFELDKNEYELGLGIHGESGVERKKLVPAKEICDEMLRKLVGCKRLNLQKNDPIVILLNNLGSVSQLEMGILNNEIINWFLSNEYNVKCAISGTIMTSIDAHGFSITILRIIDEKWMDCLLDSKSAVSALWTISKINKEPTFDQKAFAFTSVDHSSKSVKLGSEISTDVQILLRACLDEACKSLISAESELNHLDSLIGDGDCGTSMSSAAKAILNSMGKDELNFTHPKSLFLQLSKLFESSIGGTSGAIYALMFNSAANAFDDQPLSSKVLKEALKLALTSIQYYAGAKPGFRTLVDPLDAAANCPGEAWDDVVTMVEESAQQTAKMEAKAGRASYTDKIRQMEPDPGAKGFAIWFRAVFDQYKKSKNT